MTTFTAKQINAYLSKERMTRFANDLSELVRMRSESANPVFAGNLRVVVRHLASLAQTRGFKTEILEAKANDRTYPALLASCVVNQQAPTVLVYNHADVQPEGKRALWCGVDPWAGQIKDGVVYGRGATDDKGPLLGTMYALDFLIKKNLLDCNVQLLVETAEEDGSPGFEELLRAGMSQNKIKKPEVVFVSDTEFKEGHPVLTASLRGLIACTVGLKLSDAAVHSGIAGGVAYNPARILFDVLNSLGNPYNLKTSIPGFYDGCTEPPGAQSALEHTAKYLTSAGFHAAMKMHVQATTDPVDLLRRTGLQPTYEFNVFEAGSAGTSIPAEAKAFVSMRLVAGQDPKAIVQAFVTELDKEYRTAAPYSLYRGVKLVPSFEGVPGRIEVRTPCIIPAFQTDPTTQYHDKARAAYRRFFDKEPLTFFEGGTIGTLPILQRALGIDTPVVLFAQSLDTDGYHAEGEHYELAHAKKAMGAVADFFANI